MCVNGSGDGMYARLNSLVIDVANIYFYFLDFSFVAELRSTRINNITSTKIVRASMDRSEQRQRKKHPLF